MMASRNCSLRECKGLCSANVISAKDLSEEERVLLRLRSGVIRVDAICGNHKLNFLDFFFSRQSKNCCDPYRKHKKAITLGTEVTLAFARQYSFLIPGQKICSNCKRQVEAGVVPEIEEKTEEPGRSQSDDFFGSQKSSSSGPLMKASKSDDMLYPTPPDLALEKLNRGLLAFDLPIVVKKDLKSSTFRATLLDSMHEAVFSTVTKATGDEVSTVQNNIVINSDNFKEVLYQLKEAFAQSDDKRRQLQILSLLPKSWNVSKIVGEFPVTRYFAKLAKSLVSNFGIIPDIPKKRGKVLSEELKTAVINFYLDDENSRVLPGAKDYVTVLVDKEKIKVQKRLVLCNLNELYSLFKEEHPDLKISLSRFSMLRPKECVLAGASGTHTVCVCMYHQNFLLLIDAAHLQEDESGKVMTSDDVLKLVICDMPTKECYVGQCTNCPNTDELKEKIELTFQLRSEEKVYYKQWESTDRTALNNFELPCAEFVDKVIRQIPSVLEHDYIAKQQAAFLRQKKEQLEENECIVIGDFSENYSPVWQDAIPGVHWDSMQITLHPFVAYHKVNGELKIVKFVCVSDDRHHNNEAVFSFIKKIVPYLSLQILNLKKIFYFSDGAAQQYKNRKNVVNLRCHFEDFGVAAEWHFFATSHGKGPCDGLGGTLKRLARRESLQTKKNVESKKNSNIKTVEISNPQQFYTWAKAKFENSMRIEFVSEEEIKTNKEEFKERFSQAPDVQGIHSSHCVIPLSKNVVLLKQFSSSDTGMYKYFGAMDRVSFEDFHGFIVFYQDKSWNLGYVIERNQERNEIEITVLEQSGIGFNRLFQFPTSLATVTTTVNDVIAIVNIDSDDKGISLKKNYHTYANSKVKARIAHEKPGGPQPSKRRKQ